MKTEMLFACQGGTYRGEYCGIIMVGHALPLAFRQLPEVDSEGVGFLDLWEATGDVEEMFVDNMRLEWLPDGPGIYYVSAEFDIDEVHDDADDYNWEHLADKHPRKATINEVVAAMSNLGGWKWR